MEVSTEKTILANLVNNDPFMRKVLPFIKEEYFSDRVDRKVFKVINEFVSKYKNAPDKDALFICISESGDMSESEFNEAKELIRDITSYDNKDADDKW